MSNLPIPPTFPHGIVASEHSKFLHGFLNGGLIEHSPGAMFTLPEDNATDGVVSALRYNPDTDEFEGYYNDGWNALGGGGGRWDTLPPAASYIAETGHGYIINSSSTTSTLTLPTTHIIGDSVSLVDAYSGFSNHPLTVKTAGGEKIYGQSENLLLATSNMAATFTWIGDTQGWVITSGVGLGQGRVNNRVVMIMTMPVDTAHIDLPYTPDFVDVYANGLRKSEHTYTLVPGGGIDFNPIIAAGTELQIIEYTPVNLSGQSGQNTFKVASQMEMLALVALQGDIAVRSDINATYRLAAAPSNNLANWVQLQGGFKTADGKTSGVTLAQAGSNSDITQLTALSGPLRLGADGASAYDAVTLKQLQASGGGGGASMTGVMNNHIGAVQWFNGSRAKFPAGHVASDGQLLLRADYPDIWAAINSGMFRSVTDTQWLNGPSSSYKGQYRGMYSTGDGSTTFRIPDLNGALTDSIRAVFLRGDAAGQSTTTIGTVGEIIGSAVPNLTGEIQMHSAPDGTNIATVAGNSWTGTATTTTGFRDGGTRGTAASSISRIGFDSSLASPVYGRKNADGTTAANEVRPNSVAGIWIIRVTGAFTAANTSFSVINGDATKPSNGVAAKGGIFKSDYQIGGISEGSMVLYSNNIIGGLYSVNLEVYNKTKGTTATYSFDDAGNLTTPGRVNALLTAGTWNNTSPMIKGSVTSANTDSYTPLAQGIFVATGKWTLLNSIGFYGGGPGGDPNLSGLALVSTDGGSYSARYVFKNSGSIGGPNGDFNPSPTSDINIKHSIEDFDGVESLNNINAMDFKTFIFNDDENDVIRRGLIAQQIETIDPQYVHHSTRFVKGTDDIEEVLTLDTTPLLLDALAAIKVLSQQNIDLQKQIDELKNTTP